ncbi:MAG: Rne/Rng family ribonuclease [Azonexus sp.]|jgi:ribonuclease E|nr:Rne/Rng family ribonuclease [Azonexus sp.]
MKRMLFNATQAEELRVAIVDGQKLIDLDIESAAKEERKSNIYKGVVTRIEPSLEACFVDYGAERHGFLPFKEVSRAYFQPGVEVSKAGIKEALKEGQELIVQVDKDERGNKGAALTTYVSLAGRYLVLMPNNPRGGGVSRRVDGDDRAELREIMDQLEVPGGMSLIARTAAIGRQTEELQWDLNYLLQLWSAIEGAARQESGAFLIYLEGSLVIRAIRDYFQPDIGEILIDTDDVFEQARAFMGTVMPGNVSRVKRYRDDVPLFSRFQIEHQIETAFARQVNLPSGGAIVIDHTEALVAVDVNSGRATRGSDIEETALKTNLEAADELARQLRLRDLGGLIVIDFIDMESSKNQREVENRLKDGLRFDRARVQMGKISRFGLMELSRQRLRPALAETSYISCPRCTGTGHIRSTESAALHILRILEEEAMKENSRAVHVQMPVDVATFLLNEKRPDIAAIELRHKVDILLIPNIHLETPAHKITRLRHEDMGSEDTREPSYRMVDVPAEEAVKLAAQQEVAKPRQEAVVKSISPEQPAPLVAEKRAAAKAAPVAPAKPGLLARIAAWFSGGETAPAPAAKPEPARKPRQSRNENRSENRRNGRSNNRREEERSPRQERGNRAENAPRDEAANAASSGERKERKPRREKTERQTEQRPAPEAIETASLTTPPPADSETQETGGENASRRRTRRGSRSRGEGRRQDGEALALTPEAEAAAATDETTAATPEPAEAAPIVVVIEAAPDEEPLAAQVAVEAPPEVAAAAAETAPEIAASPAATVIEPAARIPAPAVETAPVIVDIAEPVVATVAEQAPVSPPAPVITAAPIAITTENLEQTLADSGLVLVQTTTTAAVAQAEPPARLGRPRKPKADLGQTADEPLQMVETSK